MQPLQCSASPERASTPPGGVSDADLGRMLVCLFTSLLRGLPSMPPAEAAVAEAHAVRLHSSLVAACPR
jgi:hypothetical protein